MMKFGWFENRPDIQFMSTMYNETDYGMQSIQQAINIINNLSTISNKITVDPNLAEKAVNINIGETIGLKNAIMQLCMACKGYLKIGRDKSYKILPIKLSGESTSKIDFDNMYKEPEIKLDKRIIGVTVNYLLLGQRYSTTVKTDAINGTITEITCNFINNQEQAREIGQFYLEYLQKFKISVFYRGDMSIESGDIIDVETIYGIKQMLVLNHNIDYNKSEYLSGNLSGVLL